MTLSSIARAAVIAALAVALAACSSLVETDGLTGGEAGSLASGGASARARRTDLYYKTFGDPSKRAVVFLHGGPGGNGYGFEMVSAAALAARGNYVVVYDQRGSGRSPGASPQDFTYAKATQDLDDLIHALGLQRPVLMGASWGGTLAVKYMDRYPGSAKGIVLVGSPMDYPASLLNIHQRSEQFYRERWAFYEADEVSRLRTRMFPQGLKAPFRFLPDDVVATMKHAQACGLFFPSLPSLDGLGTYASLAVEADFDLLTKINEEAFKLFHTNERLGETDFSQLFAKLASRTYGIYGAEDGLYDRSQLARIESSISRSHFTIVEGAAHGVPMDQPSIFLDVASRYLAELDR